MYLDREVRGRNSVVESLLPKQVVVGSSPIARSEESFGNPHPHGRLEGDENQAEIVEAYPGHSGG